MSEIKLLKKILKKSSYTNPFIRGKMRIKRGNFSEKSCQKKSEKMGSIKMLEIIENRKMLNLPLKIN